MNTCALKPLLPAFYFWYTWNIEETMHNFICWKTQKVYKARSTQNGSTGVIFQWHDCFVRHMTCYLFNMLEKVPYSTWWVFHHLWDQWFCGSKSAGVWGGTIKGIRSRRNVCSGTNSREQAKDTICWTSFKFALISEIKLDYGSDVSSMAGSPLKYGSLAFVPCVWWEAIVCSFKGFIFYCSIAVSLNREITLIFTSHTFIHSSPYWRLCLLSYENLVSFL